MINLISKALFLLMLITGYLAAQDAVGNIHGKITDVETRQPLAGVNVILEGLSLGAATDAAGNFQITGVPVGVHTISADYIGYQKISRTDVVVRGGRITFVNIELAEAAIEGQAVTVESDFFQKDAANPSANSFSAEEIRRSPGGGGDISRILSALPSVSSRGETSQDIMVRGGSPLENGFFVDNIPIPQVNHFTSPSGASNGPIGIINTDLIDNVDFYTGGFSAKFGDRLSSVVNIDYREGNRETFDGQLEMNFAGFGGVFEGPLAKRGSWLVSGRRSYLDLVADAINAGGAPRFEDLQTKIVLDINPKNKITILNIYGASQFQQEKEDALDEGFDEYFKVNNRQNTIGANWFSLLGTSAWSNTSASFTHKTFDFYSNASRSDIRLVENNFSENTLHLRHSTFFQPGSVANIELGFNYDYHFDNFSLQLLVPDTTISGVIIPVETRDNVDVSGARMGAFASLTLKPAARLTTVFGIRGSYSGFNEQTVIEPRFSLSYQFTSRLTLNGSAGIFHQGVSNYLISRDKQFRNLRDLQSRHIIAGVEYLLTPDTRLSLEFFDKDYSDIPEPTPATATRGPLYLPDDRFGASNWGLLTNNGTAYARGVEFLIQKKMAVNFYGMISGSYFRSRYEDFNGVTRDRDYDNRVLFSVIGGYHPNKKWELSVRWTYLGARPYTEIDVAASLAAGTEIRKTDAVNEASLPAYHALFLRADRRFNFRNATIVLYTSIWNAYNRTNLDEYAWSQTKREILEVKQFSLLPIFGLEYEF
ncbi:MAG: TonB-dependent receptor [Calditrichaeota bacterium]|nr:TonB-dependent receptor [Calditrichota bacterium]MCB0268404.1 TonB-dependent receptor [Calditrichota bacterium]